jgi:hypothetical protein
MTVPTIDGGDTETLVSFWVGIDGLNEDLVIQ